MFLGVVETIAGKLLWLGLGIDNCLFFERRFW